MGWWGGDRLFQTSPIPRSPDGDNNSERPVDALAENIYYKLTDNLESRDASASKKENQLNYVIQL